MKNPKKLWSCKNSTIISITSGLIATLLFIIGLLISYDEVHPQNGLEFVGVIITLCMVIALLSGLIALVQNILALFTNLDNLCWLVSLVISALLINCMFFTTFQYIMKKRGSLQEGSYQLNRLSKELSAYAEDNNGFLPSMDQWCDLLIKHNKKFPKKYFRLLENNGAECNFAFNENINGLSLSKVNSETVLLFKAMGNWNLSGGKELSESYLKNHMNTVVILINGKVEYLSSDDDLKKLRWQP